MTENSNEDANNEFYEEAREILNEPVRTRAQKEFNKDHKNIVNEISQGQQQQLTITR